MAGIARDIVLRAGVADRQLAPAAATPDKAGEQGIAMLGRTMMPACRNVLAHHPADRLRPLPIEVPFVRARLQRQPFLARLATALGAGDRAAVLRHGASFTIGIGTAVDWVGHHPVDGGVARPAPDDLATSPPGRQVEPVLAEPQERLTCAAEFRHLVEDQADCLLDCPASALMRQKGRVEEGRISGPS
jgi:hypothetical protein